MSNEKKDRAHGGTLNLITGNLYKAAGNVLAKIVPPQSKVYRAIVMMGLSATSKAKLAKRTLLHCEMSIVDHCNLKCVGCSSYGSIAKERFLDIKAFTRDIKRLAELTDGRLEMLNILGGEPLLHPELLSFVRTTRDHFPIIDRMGGGGTECPQPNQRCYEWYFVA